MQNVGMKWNSLYCKLLISRTRLSILPVHNQESNMEIRKETSLWDGWVYQRDRWDMVNSLSLFTMCIFYILPAASGTTAALK